MKGRPASLPRLFLLMFSVLALFAGEVYGTELTLPDNLFFYMPVASVWGQSPIWINPASIDPQHSGTMLMATHRRQRIVRDWGSAVTLKMIGVAFRHIENDDEPDHDEYIITMAGGKKTRVGISYRFIKNAPGHLKNRHLWNIGVQFRKSRDISFGARVENLNRGKINGAKTDRRFVYGIAARVYRDLVTVALDIDMTQKENLNIADYRTGIEIRPMQGMYIFADFDNHSRFNFGFRLNFGSAYVGHYNNLDRNGKSYLATSYIGSVKGKQPSLTKPKGKPRGFSSCRNAHTGLMENQPVQRKSDQSGFQVSGK